ncbi:MAG TPA: HyaD/HybD family hydrogenase maturation endopeptidase [Thiobacillaceae bacterium]|nr:HyaD/HybD family hydrogenase maturation endopeptidase [Thiobacillaceae bacterium]HNU63325.1 HyaD/HybD family hydrogenase maturation endopeptidase [Thiobacillaceae bacterium]
MTDTLDYGSDTLVLGIGNLLWADEGFGIRALECLHARWRFAAGTRLLDGGTQGLYLLPFVEHCRRLLILDAVDYGLPPGTLKTVQDGEVPAFMGARKMSLHQTGFQEVLAVATLRGWQPEHLALIGMQPERLEDYGGSLTDTVKAELPTAVGLAVDFLRAWGAVPQRRTSPPGPGERITLDSLGMVPYEVQRPDAGLACRFGDGRFLFPARAC